MNPKHYGLRPLLRPVPFAGFLRPAILKHPLSSSDGGTKRDSAISTCTWLVAGWRLPLLPKPRHVWPARLLYDTAEAAIPQSSTSATAWPTLWQIGRASCRER